MLFIPRTPDEISAEWLTHVLDAPVTGCRVVDDHQGTTGRAVIALDYNGSEHALPRRLFVKLPPSDEQQRAFVQENGMGRREAMFYRQLASELPVRVPRCYHADWEDSGERYIMLLEHLEDSGCTFRNASTRYSLDYVRSVLAAFARLHAAYWQSPRFDTDLAWVEPPQQHPIARRLVARALEGHGASMPPVFTAMGELYLAETDAIHALWRQGSDTLIHGDVHDGNLFFDADEPGFLDWAVLARGPGMRDVGYFLAGTLTPEHQRAHRHELLEYYRNQLSAGGAAAPSMAELYRQYQWHAGYVWLGAAVTLAMGDAWQPANYLLRSLERLHPALEELDTLGALHAALEATT